MALRTALSTSLTRSRGTLALAAALAVLALTAACSSGLPTATPTPTPTPTPVPRVFDIDADSLIREVVGVLTEAEVTCLRQQLGEEAYNALLGQPVMEDGVLDLVLPVECLANETVVGLVVAGLEAAAGSLSDASIACIRGTFAGVDVAALGSLDPSEIDLSDAQSSLGAALGLLLCLTDDEAGRIDASGLLGDANGMSLVQLRCVVEGVDLTALLAGGGDPSAFLEAFAECGVDLEGAMGDAMGELGDLGDLSTLIPTGEAPDLSQIDVEAFTACLTEALGEQALSEILNGERLPTFSELSSLSACDLDLAQLSDLTGSLGG